jgi:hypothetical protein
MGTLTKAILVTASTLALAVSTASAEIVCNDEGDCWHAKRSDYRPDLKLHIHPDNWKWSGSERYKWHEHEGHGYWHGGVWVDVK